MLRSSAVEDIFRAEPSPVPSLQGGVETITPGDYRAALGMFASGVTVVTIRAGDRVHGLTVSAFASVSPDPPLVAVMIDSRHTAHGLLEREGASFAVNILSQRQTAVSERFARLKEGDRFAGEPWTTAASGAPVLADAAAWLDCIVHDRARAGTHTIYIGKVLASNVPEPGGPPLVYWNRAYRRLEDAPLKPEEEAGSRS